MLYIQDPIFGCSASFDVPAERNIFFDQSDLFLAGSWADT